MSTYTQTCYHIVFSTKGRQPVLNKENRKDLFQYIWGILKNKNCYLYRIGGVEDHIHILTSLHPTVCLADLIKAIKVGTSVWIKEGRMFQGFTHWQDGYGAFTHSSREKDGLIEYIKSQEERHQRLSFTDELRNLLREAGIEFDEEFLA